MENQHEDSAGAETEEEIPDEFQCCVCLDLLFKPVVLACGHISCFWCVFSSMDSWQVSHCPICRHPYNHFPAICQLLHFLLLKFYPITYKQREERVIEEEKRSKYFSPQLGNCLSGSEPIKGLSSHSGILPDSTISSCNKVSLGSYSTVEGEPSAIKGSPESMTVPCKEDKIFVLAKSNLEENEHVASEENSMTGDKFKKWKNSKQVHITNLLCPICKELLYRPIVLNCGHVYCEACIISLDNMAFRCQVCQSAHPNGYPKVCLVLEHFLEEQFSEQYALRKEAVCKQGNSQDGNRPTCPALSPLKTAELPSISTGRYLSWFSRRGPKVHYGVGCDYCGRYPIVGERYRCKDCKDEMGFDLCESCHNSSSQLPGRFNQQHTPEHNLEIVQPNSIHS